MTEIDHKSYLQLQHQARTRCKFLRPTAVHPQDLCLHVRVLLQKSPQTRLAQKLLAEQLTLLVHGGECRKFVH